MKIFFCFLIFIFYFIFNINAQTLSEDRISKLEKIYNSKQAALQKEENKLDSLKQKLKVRAALIDSEKSKAEPDEDKIKDMMSSSISLTNTIEANQKKIVKLKDEINSYQKKLREKYSAAIDSLKSLESSNNFKGDKEEINELISNYTLKKIIISPEITCLSFNPKKILEFNLNNRDSLNKNLYNDYLQNALEEVNNYLKNINEQISEADGIIKLQKKTKEFLEEIEFDNRINPHPIASARGNEASSLDGNVINESVSKRVNSFHSLLSQLSLLNSFNIQNKIKTSFETKNNNISLSEYRDLLKEVKNGLEEYKTVLESKINSAK